ncbi:ribokinase [Aquipuribacter sp. MA13-6]|uniref:ribokinase n=1 Tax=unclassified Aquipuribacter TaxID=2635084 RepID=UPI003EEBAA40
MTGLVCVVGSLNDDTTLTVPALPSPGETTLTRSPRLTSPGGKGANQAAAAAVLGARVAMVGAVGDDEPGKKSLAALRTVGVDVTAVAVRDDVGTGIAVITVDTEGENTIVVDPGANNSLTAQQVSEAVAAAEPTVLLLQLEVPFEAVTAAARAAGDALVVLNPAPMPVDPEVVRKTLSLVDVLVPNRSELGRLAGRDQPTNAAEVADCVAALGHTGSVVVTLGAEGALCFEPGATPVSVPGILTATRDASGAGDVFCGCLARELARGTGLVDAVRSANTVAAASTVHPGARIRVDGGQLVGPGAQDSPRGP